MNPEQLVFKQDQWRFFKILGLEKEFLSNAQTEDELAIFIDGKKVLKLDPKNFHAVDIPFPSIVPMDSPACAH